jgi:hypothetical protein
MPDRAGEDLRRRPVWSACASVLVWIHSAVGVALAGGLLFFASVHKEPLAIGILGCAMPWMLAFLPLRRRGPDDFRRKIGSPRRRLSRKLLVGLAIGQSPRRAFHARRSSRGDPDHPADVVLVGVVLLRWVICDGLDLPFPPAELGDLGRRPVFGGIWNVSVPFLAAVFLWR